MVAFRSLHPTNSSSIFHCFNFFFFLGGGGVAYAKK